MWPFASYFWSSYGYLVLMLIRHTNLVFYFLSSHLTTYHSIKVFTLLLCLIWACVLEGFPNHLTIEFHDRLSKTTNIWWQCSWGSLLKEQFWCSIGEGKVSLCVGITTLIIPISACDTKSQTCIISPSLKICEGWHFLLNDTKFMNTCSFTIHFKKIKN